MGTIVPAISGPKRPQDYIALTEAAAAFGAYIKGQRPDKSVPVEEKAEMTGEGGQPAPHHIPGDIGHHNSQAVEGEDYKLHDGSIVIASITSCTNTSNPYVMIGAGLVARKARALGLTRKPWVKTSLAPGSQVVSAYLEAAELQEDLDAIGFNLVGYGCTTCIGNSGPIQKELSDAISKGDLIATSILSGNRNFEGRISPDVRANYLASPPLVVAYSLVGDMNVDITTEPLGQDKDGNDVFLKDIWPCTYVQNPPYFQGMGAEPGTISNIDGAKVLAILGDMITTDHISPAGSFKESTPAGKYLIERQVQPREFNSYGSRRGNHEIMMRGTFANIRIRNEMLDGVEGGYTRGPDGKQTSIYDAAMAHQENGTPLVIFGGEQYGAGSSRDWAAKGTALLGVKAVIAESFERIHRSNLVGMGVIPFEFTGGDTRKSLGLTGEETVSISGLDTIKPLEVVPCTITMADGSTREIQLKCRIDTAIEIEYIEHGGVLHYVLRNLAQAA
jgi:aconitate hydratase